MSKTNRISTASQPSNFSNDDPEEGTRLCFMPFKKKSNNVGKMNSAGERAQGRKTTDLVAGSFVSLSVAIAKMGGIDVYNAVRTDTVDDLKRAFKSRFYLERINYPNEDSLTLMHLAAIHNRGEIINLLVQNGGAVDITIGTDEESPLHLAAKHNSCEAVKALIQNDALLDVMDYVNRTPLHYACEHGSNEAVETILREAELKNEVRNIINLYDKERIAPLHLAVIACTVDTVERLLRYGANIYRKDVAGHTALLLAAKRKRNDIMKVILNHASTQGKHDYVRVPNELGMTAIHLAVDSGSIENTELCLAFGADMESQSSELLTPLHLAAWNGFYEITETLINRGAKVNTPDSKLRTCLHYAALGNNVKLMMLLLNNGAMIEVKDEKLQTPLMVAARQDSVDALEFLIRNGADTLARDQDNKSCLHLIAEKYCKKSLNVILEVSGKDLINFRDVAGHTPALSAAVAGSVAVLQFLGKEFEDCVKRHEDEKGNNILHLAALHNHRDTVKIILDQMPFMNVNSRNLLGQRPLHLAAINGNNRVIQHLVKRGASVNIRDNSGWHPLHYASKYGFASSVKLLLSKDATVDVVNETKKTPLLLACEAGHTEVATLLLEKGADPSIRNDKGQNCLDLACEFRRNDIGIAIVKTKYWDKAMDNRAYDGYNPMKRLIERLPLVAESVMDKSVTYTKSKYGKDEWKQVSFDFTHLESSPEDNHLQDVKDKYLALTSITALDRVRLMKHPLITAYAYFKWKSVLQIVYYLKILSDIFYLLGLGIPIGMNTLNFLSVATVNESSAGSNYATLVKPGVPSRNIVVFVTVMVMLISLTYFFFAGKRIFIYFFKQSLFEAIICILGLFYCLPFNKTINYGIIRIGALIVFCLVVNIIFILRNLYGVGLYISMFIQTMITILKASSVFVLFILAFAISFSMILSDLTMFRTFDVALVTVMAMMTGDLNYSDAFERLESTGRLTGLKYELLLFVAFIIIVNIAFANLLIGLAVGDIHQVMETASLFQAKNHFQLIIGSYESYPLFLKKIMHKPGFTIRMDNHSGYLQRQLWSYLTSKITSIHEEDENTSQETDLKELKALVLKQQTEISRLKELIEDAKSDINFHGGYNREDMKKSIDKVLEAIHSKII